MDEFDDSELGLPDDINGGSDLGDDLEPGADTDIEIDLESVMEPAGARAAEHARASPRLRASRRRPPGQDRAEGGEKSRQEGCKETCEESQVRSRRARKRRRPTCAQGRQEVGGEGSKAAGSKKAAGRKKSGGKGRKKGGRR